MLGNVLAAVVLGAASPSPEAVKQVWDFFEHGQGVVLGEVQLCTELTKTADNKNPCAHEVSGAVKAGTPLYVLQSYLVPRSEEAKDVSIVVKEGETVRETKPVGLMKGSWRVRVWSGVKLDHPGAWSIHVLEGARVLKRIDVKVE